MEKSFKRNIESLDEVFDFLGGFISSHSLREALAFKLRFTVEEVFTNMVKYNAQDAHDISIDLGVDAGKVKVRLIDFEDVPFDFTKREFDSTIPLEQRKPGGLGIHLVKNLADKVDYERAGNKSIITLTMKLE